MEKFDATGARREQITLQFRGAGNGEKPGRVTRTINLKIDTAGTVAGIPNSQFNSPAELGAILAKSAQCQECIVRQYFRYTAGRLDTEADRPLILKVTDAFRKSQFRFQEMIVALTIMREFPQQAESRAGRGVKNVASNH
jgi:hypothetical protein